MKWPRGIWEVIARMAVPAAVGNIIAVVHNLTDTFCAGLLGMTDSSASSHQQRAV
ncbi:MAG: hypothetical protein IKS62_00715 [Aeriscardovia sp.]|nr:hypothetical protein [Aeriscardovia sp.]